MAALPKRIDDRAKDLLVEALERPAGERSAFLARRCGDEEQLRTAVMALLRAHELAEETFDVDVAAVVAEQAGEHIGHYKLLQQIGEGGFGVVWMAEQEEPVRRKVALKVLKAGMDTAQVVGRFEAERQALALMDHPHIAKVFDGGATSTGRPYFVMELVKGVPITRFCDDAGLGMAQRLELFVPVCQAVQHAHQKGVIHRDLKPSNVLVTLHDGVPVPKVIDFGIAKATGARLTDRTVFTEFRQMLGTPEYMAPEQAELSGLDVDTRADIYSLGVLLYELLTGTRPFELKTLLQSGYAEMLRTIKEVDPPKPSTRVSTLGEQLLDIARHRKVHPRAFGALMRGDLDWIVMKALEKERSRRYETATALAEDVLRHLRHEPVLASPPSRLYRWRKYARRHRVGVAATAAIAVSLLAGAIVSTFAYLEADAQSVRATAAADEARTERNAAQLARAEEAKQKEAALLAQRDAERQRAAAELARAGEATQRQLAEEREKQANAALTKATKVTTLLREVLVRSDPHSARGKDYPVRLLLAEFTTQLGDSLEGEPEVEADLRVTLGRSYLGLGLSEKAEPELRRGLELSRQATGENSDATATAWLEWAMLAHARHDYPGAIDAAMKAVSIWSAGGFEDRAADAKRWLSDFQLHLDRFDTAVDLARQSLADERALHDEAHDDVAAARQALAKAMAAKGLLAAARVEAEQALASDFDRLGPEHPFVASRLLMVASVRDDVGDTAGAEQAARQALEIRRQCLGDAHPETAQAMSALAGILVNRQRTESAVEMYREALAIVQRARLADSPQGLTTLHNLGLALAELGQYHEAEKCLRQALELAESCYGLVHTEVATCLDTLGTVLLEAGATTEALSLNRRGLQMRQQIFGEQHVQVAKAASNLSAVLARVGDYAGAAESAARARRILEATGSTDVPSYGLATLNLAIACNHLQRFGEAEQLLRAALPDIERLGGDRSPTLASAWSTLGCSLRDQKRYDEAEPCMRKAVEVAKRRAPTHPNVAWGLNNLGTLLQAKGDHAGAEAAFAEGVQILTKVFGERNPDVGMLLANLSFTSSSRGHVDAALDQARRAVAAFEGTPEAPLRPGALQRLGNALAAKGNDAEAVDCLQQAIALHRRLRLPDDESFAAMLIETGNLLLRRRRAAEAEPLLRECQQLLARLDPTGTNQYSVQGLVGGALVQQQKFAEAEPLLQQSLARLPADPGPARPRLIGWLAEALDGLGRAAEAAEWRAKVPPAAGR